MKRTRDDRKCVHTPLNDRERVLGALNTLVSPLFFESLHDKPTDALRSLLMTLRQTPPS